MYDLGTPTTTSYEWNDLDYSEKEKLAKRINDRLVTDVNHKDKVIQKVINLIRFNAQASIYAGHLVLENRGIKVHLPLDIQLVEHWYSTM